MIRRPHPLGTPPWLWLVLGLVLFYLAPNALPGVLREAVMTFDPASPTTDSPLVTWLGRSAQFTVAVMLGLVVFAGLVPVLLPHLRAAYLERRYRLTTTAAANPAIVEITQFVQVFAPSLVIRANLQRPSPLLFIYPRGYRAAALAIFAGFVRLWRADRRAAEAVLLHEIGHFRQGDHLVLGFGSLYEFAFTKLILLCFLVVLAPLLTLAVTALVTTLVDGASLPLIITALGLIPLGLIGALAITLLLGFANLTLIMLVVATIWLTEFTADHFAAHHQGTSAGVLAGLAYGGRAPRWTWLLVALSHPPRRLRRALLNLSAAQRSRWLALLFPLAALASLAVLTGQQSFFDAFAGRNLADGVATFWLIQLGFFVTAVRRFLWLPALLLLTWPWLARGWTWVPWQGREPVDTEASYQPYLLGGGLAASLWCLAWLWGADRSGP